MRTLRRNQPLIDCWFDFLPPGQQETAQALHAAILQAVPQADLVVRSGNLYYTAGEEFVLALAPHRTHVHLQVLTGGEPSPAFPHLTRSGKTLMWRFKHGDPIDAAAVSRLAMVAFSVVRVPARHHART